MKRSILGIAIAAVVLYAWGFLIWAVVPYPHAVWKKPVDEEGARKALKELFPERGTYVVPTAEHDQAAKETLFKEGPVAMIHMTHPAGRPLADPAIMIGGFALNLVGLVLIAIILRRLAAAMPAYFERVGFVALVGLTAAVLIDGGDAVWWQIPWPWKLYQAFYDFSFWLIAGLILAGFVGARGREKAGREANH
jgi:hypothetical protein